MKIPSLLSRLFFLACLVLMMSPTTAFTTPVTRLRTSVPGPTSTSLYRSKHAAATTIAGNLWPTLQRFQITPAVAKEIGKNVLEITQWQDIVLLATMAFGAFPIAKLSYERLSDDEKQKPLYKRKRFGISTFVSEFGKVALSVYAVDVLCVILSTLGFKFVYDWSLPSVYAKTAYVGWLLRKGLTMKTYALCKYYKVDPEEMGRVEIADRLLNGLSISLVSLLLFDWLSVKMGMAVKGFFALGSVGTLAFTLGSQKLIGQLISGVALTASNKMYVGDNVEFGDGTSGKVLKLGWMETILRGGDEKVVSVPNSVLSGQKISNMSRLRHCQVTQTLRFHYEDADEIPFLLDSISSEIKQACPKLITDGTRPFRVFWTGYKEDHLEVMVDAHFNIAPIGDAYWINRMNVMKAINTAVKKHGLEFAKLYAFEPAGEEPDWRVTPKPYSAQPPPPAIAPVPAPASAVAPPTPAPAPADMINGSVNINQAPIPNTSTPTPGI